MNIKIGLTYDDLLLIPKYSEIKSRDDIDLSVDLGKGIKLRSPIISANMASITGSKMAQVMANLGCLALLHRFTPYEDIISDFKKLIAQNNNNTNYIGCSVGVQEKDYLFVNNLVEAGCKIICVDVAHAHYKAAGDITKYIAKKYPEILLISGNVATKEGTSYLHNNGADIVKIGLGNGALCNTRIMTGNGVPSLTALEECYSVDCKIISDGGLKNSGDITKSLCFSDAVMLGSLLAGTDETPGIEIWDPKEQCFYKEYKGSSTHKEKYIEGVSTYKKCKGPVKDVIKKLEEGLRSGMSYQGVSNLIDLKKDPQFVSISHAGLIESHPHSLGKYV